MPFDLHHATGCIRNQFVCIEYLKSAGPRITGVYLAGSQENQLAETPHLRQSTAFGEFHFFGGHRLWHAPESMPRTYLPDNDGLSTETLRDGIRLVGAVEPVTNLKKSISILLLSDRPGLVLEHRIENLGLWPVELAPWAITMMRPGGTAILPVDAQPESGFLPDRRLVFWPYTRLDDPRLHFTAGQVRVASGEGRIKIGTFSESGRLAYHRSEVGFIKSIRPSGDMPYPDMGCNLEVFVNSHSTELETLGPLNRLEPGSQAILEERWEWFTEITLEALADKLLEPTAR